MNQKEKEKIVGEFYKEVDKVNERYFDFWKENTFLHWDWWVSLGLTIVWHSWIKVRNF